MKKAILVVAAFLLSGSLVFALEPFWVSSHTETADTTLNLCVTKNYLLGTSTLTTGGRGAFHGVCIDSATALSSNFAVYNSSASALNIIANIDATKVNCYYYDVNVSSGLTYTSPAGIHATILYQCY